MADIRSEDAFKVVCEAIRARRAVLWAGAGLSVYAGYPGGKAFARILAEDLGERLTDEQLILQDVAERYQQKNGRPALLERVAEIFGKDPTNTETHRLLSLIKDMPFLVTTNFDRLFEKAYGEDLIVIATDQDLWKTQDRGWGRRKTILYKPHGDVDHLDDIVVTRTDYDRFDREKNGGNEPFVWARLTTMPAEYPIIFIGYSLQDPNTRAVLDRILERLGPRDTPYYVIALDEEEGNREWYEKHNVQWIEKDGVKAIEEIVNHVTKMSYIDAEGDIARMAINQPLYERKNVRFQMTVDKNRIRKISVDADDDNLPFTITRSIQFSPGLGPAERRRLEDVIEGRSFDTVELCAPESKAKLTAEANGILLNNPEYREFDSFTLSPEPREERGVDLMVQRAHIRVPHVRVKRFVSETHLRAVLTTPCFELQLDISFANRSGTLKMMVSTLAGHIREGYETYALLNAWVEGETIQVIPPDGSVPWGIPSEFVQKVPEACNLIRSRYRYFRDLDEIQRAVSIPLVIPKEGVRVSDLQNIADAAKLIREGRKGGTLTLPLRVDEIDVAQMLGDEPVFIRLTSSEMEEIFEIFGQRVPIPYTLEGHKVVPANLAEARAELESGAETVTVIYDGSVGELYQRYLPNPSEETDKELTLP